VAKYTKRFDHILTGGNMQFDQSVLTGTEKRIFALRTLYSKYGYSQYRMTKFEDYDLYSRNKDFLLSDRVITFTDTNGRLKALKPDVTLSIVRNLADRPDDLQRLYYDENVYRVSERSNTFREIMQMGLECIGAADNACVTEVIELAAKSLEIISEDHDYILKVSDLDILIALAEDAAGRGLLRDEILRLAGDKNIHGIVELCEQNSIPEDKYSPLVALLRLYGSADEVMPELHRICEGTGAADEFFELESVLADIGAEEAAHVVVDFSIISNINYYNGLAIEGYIGGIPESVLVGGRYDMLMNRMGKRSRAIGFAVYLDTLATLGRNAGDDAIENFFVNVRAAERDLEDED